MIGSPSFAKAVITGCVSFFCFIAFGQAVQTGANCPGNSAGFEVDITAPHCKLNNGEIIVNVVTNPLVNDLTYQWSTGATTVGRAGVGINNLAPGVYSVTATDFRACTVSYNITVVADTANLGFSDRVINPICLNDNGYIQIATIFTGGLPPFTFEWSNGETGWTDYHLLSETYSVTITDSAGCHGYRTWTLGVDTDPLQLAYNEVSPDFCHQNNGYVIIGEVLNGIENSFEWSNGQSGYEDTDLTPGIYFVTTTDINGCHRVDSFTIVESTDTIPAFVTTTPTGCIPIGTATANYSSFYTVESFEWSNGSDASYITGLSAGVYSFTVTDVEGCVATASGTVNTQTTSNIIPDVSVFPATCQGGGSATSNPFGGIAPYEFTWNTGSTSNQIFSLAGGVYKLHIVDQLGCTADTSFTLPDTTSSLMISVETHNSHCVPDGWAVATATGGVPPYTFDWSNGFTKDTSINMAAGNYSVTVTDSRGCVAYCYFTIIPFTTDAIVPYLNTVSPPFCGRANGVLVGIATGGTEPYLFTWSNGVNSHGALCYNVGLAAGNYAVTITDANGCTAVASRAISDSTENIRIGMSTSAIICKSEGHILAVAYGGQAPYNYLWSGAGDIISDNISSSNFVGVTGTYYVTATDSRGCSASASAYIARNDSIIYVNGSSKPDTCDGFKGSASVVATGGASPYYYDWGNGFSSESINGLSAGDYLLTVTDINGCVANADVVVTNVSIPITVNVTSANALCDKDTGWATAAATGGEAPYKYYWSNDATTATIHGLAPGIYTVNVYDNNGCVGHGIAIILDNTANIATNITTVSASCNLYNGSAASAPAGGAPPYSFLWSTGDITAAINNLEGGVYDLVVTDVNGCTADGRAWVGTSNTHDSVSIHKPTCGASNGSATAFAAGGATPYTYAWSTGSTHDSTNNIAAGRYAVTITDNNGCKIKDTIMVTSSPDSLTTVISATNAICAAHNGVLLATVHGAQFPLQFQWSTGGSLAFIDSLAAGTYKVTITDANGCIVSATGYVHTANDGLNIRLSGTSPVCTQHNGSIITAFPGIGSPPYSYSWSNTATTSTLNGLEGGLYIVTVTDAAGCTTSSSLPLTITNNSVSINAIATATICNSHIGTINVMANGGSTPYIYAWSNSSTLSSLTGLDAGNYHLTISDQNGCSSSTTVTVINNPEPIGTGSWIRQYPVCSDSSGAINLLPFNGTSPYAYSWSNGSTASAISNLISGIYTVTIIDAIGCSVVESDTLPQNSSGGLFASAIPTPSPCGQAQGSALAWVLGGYPPYNYAWGTSPVQTADSANNLAAGNYNLTITDSKGCSATGSASISNIGGPSLTMSSTPATGANNNGTATATVSGIGNYSYHWNTGASTAVINNLAPGTYYVTVTDGNNCESAGSIVVAGTTGVSIMDQAISLNLYPNPSTGQVFIDLQIPQPANATIEWYNTLGERLQVDEVTNVQSLKKSYNLSEYATGLYIIRVITLGSSSTKSIMITR